MNYNPKLCSCKPKVETRDNPNQFKDSQEPRPDGFHGPKYNRIVSKSYQDIKLYNFKVRAGETLDLQL
jgi:hypothetical protein